MGLEGRQHLPQFGGSGCVGHQQAPASVVDGASLQPTPQPGWQQMLDGCKLLAGFAGERRQAGQRRRFLHGLVERAEDVERRAVHE